MNFNTMIRRFFTVAMLVLLLGSCRPTLSQNNGGPVTAEAPRAWTAYWDEVDNRSYNSLPDVEAETSLVTIAEQAPGNLPALINYDVAGLELANLYGKKSIVALSYVLFEPGGYLSRNWKANLNEFKEKVGPYMANVIAVWLFDEPFETARLSGIPLTTMESELEMLAGAVREAFPGVKLALNVQPYTLTYHDPSTGAKLNIGWADWGGFDAYQSPFDLAAMNTYEADLEEMLDIPASGKRTICIPYAYSPQMPSHPDYNPALPADPTNVPDPTIIALIAQQAAYESFVEAHPVIVAVISFLYNSQPGLIGLDQMPAVHAKYTGWNKELAQTAAQQAKGAE
jgi:hypothetical protein